MPITWKPIEEVKPGNVVLRHGSRWVVVENRHDLVGNAPDSGPFKPRRILEVVGGYTFGFMAGDLVRVVAFCPHPATTWKQVGGLWDWECPECGRVDGFTGEVQE